MYSFLRFAFAISYEKNQQQQESESHIHDLFGANRIAADRTIHWDLWVCSIATITPYKQRSYIHLPLLARYAVDPCYDRCSEYMTWRGLSVGGSAKIVYNSNLIMAKNAKKQKKA
jgi:hypothetical protein